MKLDHIAICILTVLAPVFWYAYIGGSKGAPAPVIQDDGTMAEIMAERFVKEELRCPATASFPAADAVRSGDGWRVTSYVDSQNGFGANVRTPWTAIVKDCGAGRWQLVSLQWGK